MKRDRPIIYQQAAHENQATAKTVSGWEFWWASSRIAGRVVRLAFKRYRNPFFALRTAWRVIHSRNDFKTTHQKIVKCQGRYYMNLHTPGWPSLAFDRSIDHAFNVFTQSPKVSLFSFIFSITNQCGFQCEHCVEWDQLNSGDSLSREALIQIIRRFEQLGVCQVHLSGGEPLNRFTDILHMLESFPSGIDFWIFTNGYRLDQQKAAALKQRGLTGVVISLDHYEPQLHDQFRGKPGSFRRAVQAAQVAHANGLLVAFSCCATNDFISSVNLHRYVAVCKDAGASFLQLLEPEAVGHYGGKQVRLTTQSRNLLDTFFKEVNFDPAYSHSLIASYPALVKRMSGCPGNGLHYLYVDAAGKVQSCPFCRRKLFPADIPDLANAIQSLRANGCPVGEWSGMNPISSNASISRQPPQKVIPVRELLQAD